MLLCIYPVCRLEENQRKENSEMAVTLDMADIKPTLYNTAYITLAAIAGIVLLKYILNRWPVKGLTDLVNAA